MCKADTHIQAFFCVPVHKNCWTTSTFWAIKPQRGLCKGPMRERNNLTNHILKFPVHLTPPVNKRVSDRRRVTQTLIQMGEIWRTNKAFWSLHAVVSELNVPQWHMCDIREVQHDYQRSPMSGKKQGHIFQHQCPTVYKVKHTNTQSQKDVQRKLCQSQ